MASTTADPKDFVLPGHEPILDGYRGLAILFVLLYHATVFFPDRGILHNTLSSIILLGWSGVDMFFVLSGFLITSILLKAKTRPHYFKNFYMRRILRIFPLYYLYLILAFGIPELLRGGTYNPPLFFEDPTPFRVLIFVLHFSNYLNALDGFQNYWLLHVWSLAVEEQYYLIWPFLVWWLNKRQLSFLCIAGIVLSFVCRWELSQEAVVNQFKVFQFTHTRFDGLLMGCLVGLNATNPTLIANGRRWGFSLSALLGILILALSVPITQSSIVNGTIDGFRQFSNPTAQLLYFPLLSLFYTTLLMGIYLQRGHWISRLVDTEPLRYLGRLSYGIYIYHMPVLWAYLNTWGTVESFAEQLLFWILYFPVPVLMAHVSMTYYERHFLNMKAKFE
ncbi:MAG: acyltransferase [Candidatus Sumerlaeia bacterium]|nr:acyltransferase [Candidatus Sumerlaeia bacterium]